MNVFNATLKLYADAARNTAMGFPATLWALGVLFVGVIALAAAEVLLFQPLGAQSVVVGFARAALQDVFIGTWLSLLGLWVMARRAVLFRHLRLHAANLFWPVLTVLFFVWIARIVIGMVPISESWLLITGVALVINPVPEVLYQQRDEGLSALQSAADFMWRNAPEWLLAQLPWLGFLWLWMTVFGPRPTPERVARMWEYSGAFLEPLHGPASVFAAQIAGVHALQLVGAVVLIVGVHVWFLFRGHLFHTLSEGNRRLRAWRARM